MYLHCSLNVTNQPLKNNSILSIGQREREMAHNLPAHKFFVKIKAYEEKYYNISQPRKGGCQKGI